MVCSAKLLSWLVMALSALASCSSARPPMRATMKWSWRSSSSKDLTVCCAVITRRVPYSLAASAEAAGDVVLRARVAGAGEDHSGRAELDELAQEHERGLAGDAGSLLHV